MKIVIKKYMQKPCKHLQDHIERRGIKIWKTMQKSDIENGVATRAIGLENIFLDPIQTQSYPMTITR